MGGIISLFLFKAIKGPIEIIFLSFQITDIWKYQLEFTLLFDFYAILFAFSVRWIASSIFIFSKFYIRAEKFFRRFHFILILFVASILILIFSVNMIRLILGWDGLGLSSYLLVIYYQSSKAYNAGMLTVLRNRVGDGLIIMACCLTLRHNCNNIWRWGLSAYSPWHYWIFILILAAFTKRAQIPFSAWLPAAIAAPTPVSSLVHSSTLVTAGVYLLIRFHRALSYREIQFFILTNGCLTILLAGVSAIKEIDMKKIVALSTLRQLGLIITCIGTGLWEICYLHLIAHAFLKALLFVSTGNIIHISNSYQDIRKASVQFHLSPISTGFLLIRNAGLSGVPFLAVFYSKDLWIEFSVISYWGLGVALFYYLRVALTVIYSTRICYHISIGYSSLHKYSPQDDSSTDSHISSLILWIAGVSRGSIIRWALFKDLPLTFIRGRGKRFTVDLILSTLIFRIIIFKFKNQNSRWVIFNIWGLPLISTKGIVLGGLIRGAVIRKSVDIRGILERGWFIGVIGIELDLLLNSHIGLMLKCIAIRSLLLLL